MSDRSGGTLNVIVFESEPAARAALEAARRGGVLVNLGGDIAVAGTAPEGGWRIAVAEDARLDPSTVDEGILLRSGALATSSTTVRRWTRAGIERHHIVDPVTGAPAGGPWRTASVVAADCVAANAAATAAIVKGEDAETWLAPLGLPVRLVRHDGSVVRLGGWPTASGETTTGIAA
jgi:thiamine biosynthesis lipoprotein